MRTWTPDYQPYLTRMEETPMVVTVDLAAGPHIPLETHPELLLVRIQLARPRPDGLRATEELADLNRAEDKLVQGFEDAGAIYVGRYVAGGYTVHAFYAPQGLRPPPPDLAPYVPGLAAKIEADWGFYTQLLYPDRWNLQLIHNRKTVQVLAAQGDQHDAPRRIDHFGYFRGQEPAVLAADRLRAAGFDVEVPRADEDGDWVLPFYSTHAVGEELMAKESAAILQIVEVDGGGDYDGWGCPVVTD